MVGSETLPFICEVRLEESYGIFDDYRGIGMTKRRVFQYFETTVII